MTQNNLGIALQERAVRGPAADRLRLLNEASAALRNAWSIYTPNHSLPYWITVGRNLLQVQLLADDFAGASATLGAFLSFDGIRHFIETDARLAPYHAFLLGPLDAAAKPNRDAILTVIDALDANQLAPNPAKSITP